MKTLHHLGWCEIQPWEWIKTIVTKSPDQKCHQNIWTSVFLKVTLKRTYLWPEQGTIMLSLFIEKHQHAWGIIMHVMETVCLHNLTPTFKCDLHIITRWHTDQTFLSAQNTSLIINWTQSCSPTFCLWPFYLVCIFRLKINELILFIVGREAEKGDHFYAGTE